MSFHSPWRQRQYCLTKRRIFQQMSIKMSGKMLQLKLPLSSLTYEYFSFQSDKYSYKFLIRQLSSTNASFNSTISYPVIFSIFLVKCTNADMIPFISLKNFYFIPFWNIPIFVFHSIGRISVFFFLCMLAISSIIYCIFFFWFGESKHWPQTLNCSIITTRSFGLQEKKRMKK